MSRRFSVYRQQKIDEMDTTAFEAFANFGYDWRSQIPQVGLKNISRRNDAEEDYFESLGINDEPDFRIISPLQRLDEKVVQVAQTRTVVLGGEPVPYTEVVKLYEKYGYMSAYVINSVDDISYILEKNIPLEKFGVLTISVSTIERILAQEEDEKAIQVLRKPIFANEKVCENQSIDLDVLQTIGPLFLEVQEDSLSFPTCVQIDNDFLVLISRSFDVSLEFLLAERGRGSSMIEIFSKLRIEIGEDWWTTILDRDRKFPDTVYSNLCRRFGIPVANMTGGIYVASILTGVGNEYSSQHPLWMLATFLQPHISKLCHQSFMVLSDICKTIAYGYFVPESDLDWIHYRMSLNQMGVAIAPGGLSLGFNNRHDYFSGMSRPVVDLDSFFFPDADWGAICRYIDAFERVPHEFVPVLWQKRKVLGARACSLEAFDSLFRSPNVYACFLDRWHNSPITYLSDVVTLSSRSFPRIGCMVSEGSNVLYHLSVKFGGRLPHEIVRHIISFCDVEVKCPVNSYIDSSVISGTSIPFLQEVGRLVLGIEDYSISYLQYNYRFVHRAKQSSIIALESAILNKTPICLLGGDDLRADMPLYQGD